MELYKSWLNYEKYIDIQFIIKQIEWADKFIIISDNGIGKTYSAVNLVLDKLEVNETSCWIRNTELEIKKTINSFAKELSKRKLLDKYEVDKDGVWSLRAKDEKKKFFVKDTLVIAFVYLSSLSSSVPQELGCTTIIIDEFIAGNEKRKFVMENYGLQIKKAVARLIRPIKENKKVKLIAYANPHVPEHDLLYSLGIDFNWDLLVKGEPSEYVDKNNNIYAICLPKQFNIKEMETTYKFLQSLDVNENSKDNYKYLPNKYKRIYPFNKNMKIECLYKLKREDVIFAFCILDDKKFYIKKSDYNEYNNVKVYCLEATQLEVDEILLKSDEDIVELFYNFVQQVINCNVYFDSDFTKEKTREFKNILNDIYNFTRIK